MQTRVTARELPAESIQEWRQIVDQLVEQISGWARHNPCWNVEIFPDEERKEDVGTFRVPVLVIRTADGELTLDPLPRRSVKGPVRASLSAWPTLRRVHLIQGEGGINWEIMTDSGVPLRKHWNEETFTLLTSDLLADL